MSILITSVKEKTMSLFLYLFIYLTQDIVKLVCPIIPVVFSHPTNIQLNYFEFLPSIPILFLVLFIFILFYLCVRNKSIIIMFILNLIVNKSGTKCLKFLVISFSRLSSERTPVKNLFLSIEKKSIKPTGLFFTYKLTHILRLRNFF